MSTNTPDQQNPDIPSASEGNDANNISNASRVEGMQQRNRVNVYIGLTAGHLPRSDNHEEWLVKQAEHVATARKPIEEFILQHDPEATFWPIGPHLVPVFTAHIDPDIFHTIHPLRPEGVNVWGCDPGYKMVLAGSKPLQETVTL